MINAVLKEKAEIQCNEDVKTSSIIGLLTLLPAELFWKLLKESLSDKTNVPICSGDIISIEFWPHWYVNEQDVDVTNSNIVEPDVFIEFEMFNLIIEVKLDGNYQYEEQWTNQVCAYKTNVESEKPLFYIALGGNATLENFTLRKGKAKGVLVHKCAWTNLLSVIHSEIIYLESSHYAYDKHCLRILQMIEKSFSIYGERITVWMESIPSDLSRLSSKILNDITKQWKIIK